MKVLSQWHHNSANPPFSVFYVPHKVAAHLNNETIYPSMTASSLRYVFACSIHSAYLWLPLNICERNIHFFGLVGGIWRYNDSHRKFVWNHSIQDKVERNLSSTERCRHNRMFMWFIHTNEHFIHKLWGRLTVIYHPDDPPLHKEVRRSVHGQTYTEFQFHLYGIQMILTWMGHAATMIGWLIANSHLDHSLQCISSMLLM